MVNSPRMKSIYKSFILFIFIIFFAFSHSKKEAVSAEDVNRSDFIFNEGRNENNISQTQSTSSLAVIEPILVVTTLDGVIYAIGQKSGSIKWRLQDDPVVRLPQMPNASDPSSSSSSQQHEHLFLPDPKDGSLYILNSVEEENTTGDGKMFKDALQKMPFTISQLVSASPCRSSDGLLYTGSKIDSWITVNAKTGEKMDVMDTETPMCKKPGEEEGKKSDMETTPSFLFGKSLYHLSIFDAKTRSKKWNITLVDYSSTASSTSGTTATTYPLLHLTSSTTGKILTIDLEAEEENDDNRTTRRLNPDDSKNVIWSLDLGSPIISMFEFDETGVKPTKKVPFTTVGDPIASPTAQSVPSLYIGESPNTKQAYALSALVPFDMRLLSRKRNRPTLPLLEGPNDTESGSHSEKNRSKRRQSKIEEYFQMLIYGYYEYPEFSKTDFSSSLMLRQMQKNLLPGPPHPPPVIGDDDHSIPVKIPFDPNDKESEEERLEEVYSSMLYFYTLIFVTAGMIVMGHYYLKSRSNAASLTEYSSLHPDTISVGKISYNSKEIIGRGSAGTCVYKGFFEGKTEIAVKRVITEHFTLAQREIELLRNLQHPNVVRYYSTEADNLFKYIAIELAEMSLADWIEKRRRRASSCSAETTSQQPDDDDLLSLSDIHILEESCKGLAHLHYNNVIHRDIKPHNVLISPRITNKKNRGNDGRNRKIFLSDFGVSKTLSSASYSFEGASSMSKDFISTTKVTKGTEGWIAPEVLLCKQRDLDEEETSENGSNASKRVISKQMDIFSMGCLFYYVLTNGYHPFGEWMERQNNIVNNKSDLSHLTKKEEDIGKLSLIQVMISKDPLDRPRIQTVLQHPLFWSSSKQLQFLQDVSDRVEKTKEGEEDKDLRKRLETDRFQVVEGDWKRKLPQVIQADLEGHRKYIASSVEHLTRAIRNKRHHYRELSEEVKTVLGEVPDGFMSFFNQTYPRLIYHCYIAMQVCRQEPLFKEYYDQDAGWEFEYPKLPPNQSVRRYRGEGSFAAMASFAPPSESSPVSSSPVKKKLSGSKMRRRKAKNKAARMKETGQGDAVITGQSQESPEEEEGSGSSFEESEEEQENQAPEKQEVEEIRLKPQSMMFGGNWKSAQPPPPPRSTSPSIPSSLIQTSTPSSPPKRSREGRR